MPENNKNLTIFLKVGFAEGISFLLLLFIAMPAKYLLDYPLLVKYVGWAHGLLFILYIIFLILAADEQGWKFKRCFLGFIASLLPFGPFVFEKGVKKGVASN